jgi:hypothetical protein
MNSMILLTALSVGQLPSPGVSPPAALPYQYQPGPRVIYQPMTQPGMPPAKNENGNGEKKDEEKKEDEEEKKDEPEPYALMRLLSVTRAGQKLNDWGVNISGWVEGNYTASTANRNNLPLTFNDRGDFWQMNQIYTKIEKTIDTEKQEFQWGGRADLLFGTDGRFTIARGLFDDQLHAPSRNGAIPDSYLFDLFQFYVEGYFPNLGPKGTTVRFGRFATHCGYELVQGAETPFIQRSYMFQYNPFTHTGAYATTQLNDTWTVSNGLVLGNDNFFGVINKPTYIGQLKWAPKEGKSNALFNVVVTDPRFNSNWNFPFYNYYGMVLTHNFTDKFTGVLDAAFSHIDGAPRPDGTTGSATWYGAAGYGIYKINDKLTSTLRVELFEDTKGFRTGSKGLYTEVTYGLAWAPVRSVIFRPTVRYDHNNTSRPFEGKPDLFTAAFDMILRY